jgi:uncharacterized protein
VIKRERYLNKIEEGFRIVPIVILIGARQVGKTTLMKTLDIHEDSLFLNGQDPEIAELFQRFSTIEQYLQVYLNSELKGYLLLDEFQFINGISTMLKLLTDKYPDIKILCSGSSSLNILQQIDESLAGRVRTFEVLSLSFAEYLLFKDENLSKIYNGLHIDIESSALTAPIEAAFSNYMLYGGLPRAALTEKPEEKIEILNDIYRTYLLKDVRSYVSNEHFVGFNKLVRILASQIGNLLNISEISRETGLPYRSCEEYLSLLEQMYIIKMIEPYFTNKRKVISKMKKVFFCDIGLRNMIEGNFNDISIRGDNGAVFENYVMLELWRNIKAGGSVQFFRTSDGTEVDFVVTQLNRKYALECKFKTLNKPLSLSALNNFCNNEAIGERYIVNRNLNISHNGAKLIQGYLTGKI